MSNLLRDVLPARGRYCIVGIKNGDVRREFVSSLDDYSGVVDRFVNSRYNVYFANAGYGVAPTHAAINAVAKRAFYLDIDVDPLLQKKNSYPSKEAAMTAVKAAINDLGWSKPTHVVDSGNGYHIYWALDEDISLSDWDALATEFKQRAVSSGLIIDPSVPADAVRLLRVDGTPNFNTPNDALVTVIFNPRKQPLSVDEFRSMLGGVAAPAPAPVKAVGGFRPITSSGAIANARAMFAGEDRISDYAAANPVKDAIYGSIDNSFPLLLERSVAGTGCNQIKEAYEDQAAVSEPLWKAILNICNATMDKYESAKTMSDQYPGYSFAEMQAKMDKIKGRSTTCAQFMALNPAGCKDCIHVKNGVSTISSPIFFSNVLKKSEVTSVVSTEINGNVKAELIGLPTLPSPYCYTSKGGIGREIELEDGTKKPDIIYPYYIYITRVAKDENGMHSVWIRAHRPKDGIIDYSMTLGTLHSLDKFREAAADAGDITSHKTATENLRMFLTEMSQDIQFKHKTEVIHAHYGWTDRDTFLIGTREYTTQGVSEATPAIALRNITNTIMQTNGSLEEWRDVIRIYEAPTEGMWGNEHFAFGILLGFGAPLMKFCREPGIVLNYYHKESGSGKSSVLYAINSIWGHTKNYILKLDDTALSIIHRMGTYSNMPVTIDEITNILPEHLSTLVYNVSSGRGRNRMSSKSNTERTNTTTWSTPVFCSSNSGAIDILQGLKAAPKGEQARLIDILCEELPDYIKEKNKYRFSKLYENYGLAGDRFITYVVNNLDSVKTLMARVRLELNAVVQFDSTERFKEEAAVVAFTAGHICAQLDLFTPDLDAVLNWLRGTMRKERSIAIAVSNASGDTVLGNFLMKYDNSTLVIHSNKTSGGASVFQNLPIIRTPKNELVVRYEYDVDKLYISSGVFGKWARAQSIGLTELTKSLATKGVTMQTIRKRMGKGTDLDIGAASVFEIYPASALGVDLDPGTTTEQVTDESDTNTVLRIA